MWKVNGQQTKDAKWWQKLTLQAILVSDWPIFKNLLLWNYWSKWIETW
jgi:hypothetical protein